MQINVCSNHESLSIILATKGRGGGLNRNREKLTNTKATDRIWYLGKKCE